jgi:hypothetical protein
MAGRARPKQSGKLFFDQEQELDEKEGAPKTKRRETPKKKKG